MVRRPAILAATALIALTGCHAGTSGNLAKAPPAPSREEIKVSQIIAQHNKNAAAIQSIQAKPGVALVGRTGRFTGKLAMERPKDFRLSLEVIRRPQADVGSNDDGFWFWVKADNEKEDKIYVCDHDQVDASPLAVTLQPDWIVEAMGFREFTAEEARTIGVKKDPTRPGSLVLTQFRKDAKGQALTKETVVDEATGEIREHRLWAGAKAELLASATISKYLTKLVSRPGTRASADADDAASGQVTVKVPSRFRLSWVKENFELDIIMDAASINPQFDEATRLALFSEPKMAGVKRTDLARLGETPSSRVYESIPQPRSGVRLGQPEPAPMGVEGAYRRTSDPVPLSADLRRSDAQPSGVAGVVRAPVPSGSDYETIPASSTNRLRGPRLDQ